MLHWDQYLSKAKESLFSEGFKVLARQCHSWPDPAPAITLLKSGAFQALSKQHSRDIGLPMHLCMC